MSAKVPEGWGVASLGSLLNVRDSRLKNDGAYPLYSLTIESGITPKTERYNREFLVKDKDSKKYKLVCPRDIAFNPSNLRWGAIAMSRETHPVIVSPIYEILSVNEAMASTAFLEFLLKSPAMINIYEHNAEGTLIERTAVKLDRFLTLDVLMPSLPEQRKIAEILASVDAAIQATQRVIDQTRVVRQGLLQDLLTKGIGHTKFKKTEIGEFPEDWQVSRLGDIAEVTYGLTVNSQRRECVDVAPYLTVANVKNGQLQLDLVKEIGTFPGDSDRYRLKKGDLLLVEGNGNPDLLGCATLWNDELPYALHQNHLIRVRSVKDGVLPQWLYLFLWSKNGRHQILREAKTSSGLHTINSGIVAGVRLPVPTLNEQKKIVSRFDTLSFTEKGVVGELESLQILKKGLLQDLLTGKVRVNVN